MRFYGLHFLGMKVMDDGRTSGVLDGILAERLNVAGDAQREGKFLLADVILREVIAEHSIDKLPVEILCPLSIRAVNVLQNTHIRTVADLVQYKLAEVRKWRKFGAVSKALLGERLRSLTLNLAGQTDYQWVLPLSDRDNQRQRLDRLLLLPTFLPIRVWTNGTDTVIAKDLNDVRALMAAGFDEFDEDATWEACANDELLEISDTNGDNTTAKTCAEWIASEGRGLLCSTEPPLSPKEPNHAST